MTPCFDTGMWGYAVLGVMAVLVIVCYVMLAIMIFDRWNN